MSREVVDGVWRGCQYCLEREVVGSVAHPWRGVVADYLASKARDSGINSHQH